VLLFRIFQVHLTVAQFLLRFIEITGSNLSLDGQMNQEDSQAGNSELMIKKIGKKYSLEH
jgi:hypothetical protein